SQLGFIPQDLRFDAVEISSRIGKTEAERKFDELRKFSSVSFSDAHHINDIGRRHTIFNLEALTFDELRQAFSHSNGRGLFWE
ncbi:MAG TPA: hypothetical protein VEI28_03990, partial [Thermodesulfovibrionales bacterium]|nr:hypothetical protein [Thermodesulfovibrionales bacterium]